MFAVGEYLFGIAKFLSPCNVLGFSWLQGQGRSSFPDCFFWCEGVAVCLCWFSSGVVSVKFACALQGWMNGLFNPSWSLVKPAKVHGKREEQLVKDSFCHDFDYLDCVCVCKYTLTVEHPGSVGQCVHLHLMFWEALEMSHFPSLIYTVPFHHFCIIPLACFVK